MTFTRVVIVSLLLAFAWAKDCWVPGRCKGYLVDLSMTSSKEDCLEHCQDLSSCKWFTYDSSHGSCATFSTCSSWDTECENCISGEFDCKVFWIPFGLRTQDFLRIAQRQLHMKTHKNQHNIIHTMLPTPCYPHNVTHKIWVLTS